MRVPTILVLDETEDLGRQVGRAIACLRPRPELVVCPGLAAMEESLVRHPAVDVLIAGPSMANPVGLLELRRRRLRLPDASLILVFDRRRTAPLRDTIRTGAVDILRLPLVDAVIVDAILQALEVRWASLPEEGEEAPGPGPGRVGEIIAVVSATGGCGKTFLATNIAYHLHARRHKRVCLIDLDLQFGELSSALRLKPKLTIIDLLSHDDEKDLSGRLQEHLVVHDTGIPVLAAPERPVEADGVDAADVGRVLDAARRKFDFVIVDTPPSLSEAVLVALEYADRVFAVATLDLPSIRNLGLLLSTMQQLKVPADRVKLLLNKVETDVGMDVAQVTRHFPQGFEMVVPYGRDVNRSLNMGMPLLAFSPGCEVSKVLGAGLATALPGLPGEDPGTSGRRGLFGRRRGRVAQADSA
jgi:pilus assembly protein CpaE